jgi:hypothetical protein
MWEAACVVAVGCGVIAALLRLNKTVGGLVAEMRHVTKEGDDHENRLRKGGL